MVPKSASPRSAASRTPSTFSRIHCGSCRREVGGRRQAGLAPDYARRGRRARAPRDPVGPGVLPDDRVVVRPAGLAVPDHRRLALVGDAEGGEVRGAEAGARTARAAPPSRCAPDLERVVLDPARRGAGSARARAGGGATRVPSWSKIMQRVLVVPWSIAATKSAIGGSPRSWSRCLLRDSPARGGWRRRRRRSRSPRGRVSNAPGRAWTPARGRTTAATRFATMVRMVATLNTPATSATPAALLAATGCVRIGIRGSHGPNTKIVNSTQGVRAGAAAAWSCGWRSARSWSWRWSCRSPSTCAWRWLWARCRTARRRPRTM